MKWCVWSLTHGNAPTRKSANSWCVPPHVARLVPRQHRSRRSGSTSKWRNHVRRTQTTTPRNHELKRTNGILKTASALFAAETRPPHDQVISYIDEYKEKFGVEAICRVLKQTDRGFIT